MKKLILPIAVIAASGAYVWAQQGQITAESGFAETAATATVPVPEAAPAVTLAPSVAVTAPPPAATPAEPPAPAENAVPATLQQRNDSDNDEDDVPLPIRRPTPVLPAGIVEVSTPAPARPPVVTTPSAQNVSNGGLADGTYNGPAANAYYGLVQVAAVIQGGHLTNVKVLQYPSDRRTSRFINSQALPLLMREAIQAQSGNVDFISGATLTSNAFAKSLSAALAQAGG